MLSNALCLSGHCCVLLRCPAGVGPAGGGASSKDCAHELARAGLAAALERLSQKLAAITVPKKKTILENGSSFRKIQTFSFKDSGFLKISLHVKEDQNNHRRAKHSLESSAPTTSNPTPESSDPTRSYIRFAKIRNADYTKHTPLKCINNSDRVRPT